MTFRLAHAQGPRLLARVEALLSQASAAQRAPMVMWARPDETEHEFADRVAQVRERHAGRILAAVPVGFHVPEGTQAVPFPAKLHALLNPFSLNPNPSRPGEPIRFRCASGGRGSGKSTAMANAVILRALSYKQRILCCREVQLSLRQSVHALLTARVEALRLQQYFTITNSEISCANGSQILFAGLWSNLDSIKSLNDLSLAWIEESESVSAQSVQILTPTIRGSHADQGRGAEVWLSCNPDSPDATAQEFVEGKRPDCIRAHVIFSDNDFFPAALEGERSYLQRVDDDRYQHVWLGSCSRVSDALIFRGKFCVEEFEVGADWPTYHGLDFGFSTDPAAAIRAHVVGTELFISAEFWGLRVELDQLSQAIERAIPGSKDQKLYCDAARPESVSFLKHHGHEYAVSAPKWSGSILDGISFLRSFTRIVVSPNCPRTLAELRSYSYKIDKLTGLPLTEPADKDNHLCDAARYALSDLITAKGEPGILQFYRNEIEKQQATKTAAAPSSDGSAPLISPLPKPSSAAETFWAAATRAGATVRSL
jgi:phage terminase large subunit